MPRTPAPLRAVQEGGGGGRDALIREVTKVQERAPREKEREEQGG